MGYAVVYAAGYAADSILAIIILISILFYSCWQWILSTRQYRLDVVQAHYLKVIVDKEKYQNKKIQSAKDDENGFTNVFPLILFGQ